MLSSFSNEQAKKWIKSNIKLIRTLNSCDLWKDYKYITAENKTLLINRYEPIAENIKDFLENFDPISYVYIMYRSELEEFIDNYNNIDKIIEESNDKFIKEEYKTAEKWIKSKIDFITSFDAATLFKDNGYIENEDKNAIINKYKPIAENIECIKNKFNGIEILHLDKLNSFVEKFNNLDDAIDKLNKKFIEKEYESAEKEINCHINKIKTFNNSDFYDNSRYIKKEDKTAIISEYKLIADEVKNFIDKFSEFDYITIQNLDLLNAFLDNYENIDGIIVKSNEKFIQKDYEPAKIEVDSYSKDISLFNSYELAKDEYITEEKKIAILNNYEPTVIKVKNFLEKFNGIEEITIPNLKELENFISNYNNIDETIKKSNEKFIQQEYKPQEKLIEDYIDDITYLNNYNNWENKEYIFKEDKKLFIEKYSQIASYVNDFLNKFGKIKEINIPHLNKLKIFLNNFSIIEHIIQISNEKFIQKKYKPQEQKIKSQVNKIKKLNSIKTEHKRYISKKDKSVLIDKYQPLASFIEDFLNKFSKIDEITIPYLEELHEFNYNFNHIDELVKKSNEKFMETEYRPQEQKIESKLKEIRELKSYESGHNDFITKQEKKLLINKYNPIKYLVNDFINRFGKIEEITIPHITELNKFIENYQNIDDIIQTSNEKFIQEKYKPAEKRINLEIDEIQHLNNYRTWECSKYISEYDKKTLIEKYKEIYTSVKDFIKRFSKIEEITLPHLEDLYKFVSNYDNIEKIVLISNKKFIDKEYKPKEKWIEDHLDVINSFNNYELLDNKKFIKEQEKQQIILEYEEIVNKINDIIKELANSNYTDYHYKKDIQAFIDNYKNIDESVEKSNAKFIDKEYKPVEEWIESKIKDIQLFNDYKLWNNERYISNNDRPDLINEYEKLASDVEEVIHKLDYFNYDNCPYRPELVEFIKNFHDIDETIRKANEKWIEENISEIRSFNSYNIRDNKEYITSKDKIDIKEEYENVADSVQSLLTDDINSYSNYKNEFIKFITNFINFHDTIKKANEIFIKNEYEPEEEWIEENIDRIILFSNPENWDNSTYITKDEICEKYKSLFNKVTNVLEKFTKVPKFSILYKKKLRIFSENYLKPDELIAISNDIFIKNEYKPVEEWFINNSKSIKSVNSYEIWQNKKVIPKNEKNTVLTEFKPLAEEVASILDKFEKANFNSYSFKEELESFLDNYNNIDETIDKNNKKWFDKNKEDIYSFNNYKLWDLKQYISKKEIPVVVEYYKLLNDNVLNCLKSENPLLKNYNNDLKAFKNNYININFTVYKSNENWVKNNKKLLRSLHTYEIWENKKYIAKRDIHDVINEYKTHFNNMKEFLKETPKSKSYIEDIKSFIEKFNNIIKKPDTLDIIIKYSNEKFIEKESKLRKPFFDNIQKGKQLDSDQTRAVLTDDDNLQIIAGAGTGKTFTLVAKVKYLTEIMGISPDEILIISFSNNSVNDLKRKMKEADLDIENISTFHSLGRSILENKGLPIDTKEYLLNKVVKDYFKEKIKNDEEKIKDLIELVGFYFDMPSDVSEIDELIELYEDGTDLHLETLKSKLYGFSNDKFGYETLQYEFVKSYYELLISNFLFLHNINYEYEKLYDGEIRYKSSIFEHFLFDDYETISFVFNGYQNRLLKEFLFDDLEVNIPESIKNKTAKDIFYNIFNNNLIPKSIKTEIGKRVSKKTDIYRNTYPYKPDFYLNDYDLYLEHFGVNRQCKALWLKDDEKIKKYTEDMYQKRRTHEKNGTKLIETFSYYHHEKRLLERLEEKLIAAGVEVKEIDYEEIYNTHLNPEKNMYKLKNLIKLIKTFINLFKGNNFSLNKFDEIRKENSLEKNEFMKNRTELFINLIEDVYIIYENYLKKNNLIDFNDMINNATAEVAKNGYDKNFKYILVDEYQDTSLTRYMLLKEIKEKTNAKLVVVGDDWQSIYGFTGCDIDLFTNFDKYFDDPAICKIENTYRNSQELIDVSGNFILKNEKQIEKELTSKSPNQIKKPVKIYEYDSNILKAPLFEQILDEIAKSNLNNNILVLGRNRKDILSITDNSDNFEVKGDVESGAPVDIIYYKNPSLNIKYMTVHKSKGLEEENLILINLEDKYAGFPNKMEDDPILKYVMIDREESETKYPEERRLFYVALTRTKNNVYLLTPEVKQSQFVEEIKEESDKVKIETYELTDDMKMDSNKTIRIPTHLKCNKCGIGNVTLVKTSKGKSFFFSCSEYPRCKGPSGIYTGSLSNIKDIEYCPHCDGITYKTTGINGPFFTCSNFQKGCKGKRDIGRNCPRCGSPLTRQINKKTGNEYIKCFGCKYTYRE